MDNRHVAEDVNSQCTQPMAPASLPSYLQTYSTSRSQERRLLLAEVVLQHSLPFGVVTVVGHNRARAADHLHSNIPLATMMLWRA